MMNNRIVDKLIKLFILSSLFVLTNIHSAKADCVEFPGKLTFFFISEEVKDSFYEPFLTQVYCDLAFWNWGAAGVSLRHAESLATSAKDTAINIFYGISGSESETPTETDLVDDPENRFTNRKTTSQGLNIARVYSGTLCMFSFCGMSYDFLDFVRTNGFLLRQYDQGTSQFTETDTLDLQVLGIGADFCLIKMTSDRIESIRWDLSGCFTPSFGSIDAAVTNTSGETSKSNSTKAYFKSRFSLGIGYDGFGKITFEKYLYSFDDILPDSCSPSTSCPQEIAILGTAWTYSFQVEF